MSLDALDMQVLLRSGTAKQQKHARAILPVIADPHWLLVTLLLCNAACFEALPLFLDTLINPVGAILISVTLILLFGEILPQAVCARHGLAIGAALGWPVRFFMWVTSPISWPLARFLDWMLGKEGYDTFMRHELKALVDLHGADEGLGGKLSDNEVQIICGALDLTNKIAYSSMTPLEKVTMLSTEQRLDRPTISMILASGHSRLPVYAGNNKTHIIGLILVKELLAHAFPTPEEMEQQGPVEVSALKIRPLPRLSGSTRCYDMLKLFQTGRAHMVLLTQPDVEQEKQDKKDDKERTSANGVSAVVVSDPGAKAAEVELVAGEIAPQSGGPTPRAESRHAVKDSKEHESVLTRTSHRLLDKILKREASVSLTHSSAAEHEAMPDVIVPDLAKPGEPIGIITIEDVLEELMGQEILDETDQFADNEGTMPVNEETRAKLAEKLPERVREVILGSGIMGMARRLSRTSGGARTKPEGSSGAGGSNFHSRTASGNIKALAAAKGKAGPSGLGPDAV